MGKTIPNADPTDKPERLQWLSSLNLERYFDYYEMSLPEPHTWLDLAQSLLVNRGFANYNIGAQAYLNLITELQNPESELYIEALKIRLSWH